MRNFYIADTHFGHANVIKYDDRPFKDVEEMDAELIRRWNERVSPGDTVHILGDFIWRPPSRWNEIVPKLHGQKILIRGNHDPKALPAEVRKNLAGFMDYKKFRDGKYHVIMSHFPMLFYDRDYDQHTVMLCGHVHTTGESELLEQFSRTIRAYRDGARFVDRAQIYNVGCMMPWMNYAPRTLEEIINGKQSHDLIRGGI